MPQYAPMAPTLVREPFRRDGWVYEEKVDGWRPPIRRRAVSLLTELDAFYLDRRRCGGLEAGVDGSVVWLTCECGASMARRADEDYRVGD
jgi:hypothetical protein